MVQLKITTKPNLGLLAKVLRGPIIEPFMRKETLRIAFLIERYAKQVTPVDTSRLRASIGVSSLVQKIGALVSTNTEYAIYVHEGTRYMRARPFMAHGVRFAQQSLAGQIGIRLDKDIADKLSKLK